MKYTEDTLRVAKDSMLNTTLRRLIYGDDIDVQRLGINFCRDTERTMGLAFEHKIGVEFIDGFGWTASHAYDLTSASCYDNPLRAVVMCLILHLQERGL